MSRITKILGGVLIFLLIVIIAEMGYYFMYSNKTSINKNPSETISIIRVSPTIPVANDRNSLYQAVFDLNSDLIRTLGKDAANGILESFLTTANYNSIIISFERKNGTIQLLDGKSWNYNIVLIIQSGQTGGRSFLFSDEELNKIKIYKKDSSNKRVPGTIGDIKNGKRIFISLTTNIMEPPGKNIIHGEIQVE